jgi:signal transduction histidine kinase/CheY-like chemotaxis protein
LELEQHHLLDRLTESVSIYDGEARLRYINAVGARLYQLPPAEILGRRSWDLVPHSDEQMRFRAALLSVLAGEPRKTLVSWVAAVGRWFEVDIYPFPEGALVIARDVTDRKLADERAAETHRLEALGRLAGGVAHDFNNLLSVILGTTELLMQHEPDESKRGELSEIVGAAERAVLVTRQLLAFGRRQRLAPQVVNLSAHVQQMERVLCRILGEDIELELELAASIGSVRVDAGQIEQVVLNLVTNARDAMPRGGRVTIATADETVPAPSLVRDAIPAGRYATLRVSDTGDGMTEAVRARVFEPFFTTKRFGRGTGLGLATVHGIVEQSSGHIRVESQIGRGTRFTVYLPSVDDEPSAVEPRPSGDPHRFSGTETVLLVEDDAQMRQYVRRALRQHGYSVLEAENGGAALLILEQHPGPVHLLVADVVMARMTGPQLAARLRAVRPELPALFMSGYPTERIDEAGRLGERDAFIPKPFGPEELLRAVRESLDR